MSQAQFPLVPRSAHEIACSLVQFAQEVATDRVQISIATTVPNLSFGHSGDPKGILESKQWQVFLANVQSRPYVACRESYIYLPESANNKHLEVQYEYNGSSGAARLHIRHIDPEKISSLKVIDALHRHFNLAFPAEVAVGVVEAADANALKFKAAVLTDFTAQVSRLGGFLTEMDRKNADELRQLTAELEKRYQERAAALDAKVSEEQAEIERLRREHEDRVAQFETRAHTFVRRKLDEKLELILEKFKDVNVSRTISGKRWVIHLACIITLCATAALCGYVVPYLVEATTVDWHRFVPFSASILAFTTTLIFYLKWNNAWFSYLAQAEFAHRKTTYDTARASWLAELLYEWKEKKDIGLPETVLKSLTTNLYHSSQWEHGSLHPADELARVLAETAKLKVGSIEYEAKRGRRKPRTK